MEPMKCEFDERIKLFEQVCKSKNIKITHQRMEIFREIATAGDHSDAESIYQRVKERLPTISLDTVYRALWLFNDLGLIKTLGATRERTRFDANLNQHHHFTCSVCGLIRDIYAKDFDELKLPNSINEIGQPYSTHVEVRGVCLTCSQNKKQDQR
ncbi:MAG: transcriptional repressor [Desulfobulbaceae bacterium]|uniref:Transcriptional repressor n=1 Tax=Candidatus Desulfatifera sulfidica TaxID=2841691 RepID=A0A8J6N9J9_9BACT|nr:transcriptional repressor [Candidatus Desulfatifera sulfidica]